MTKERRQQIIRQVRLDRAARRQVAIEQQLTVVPSHIHKTAIKDAKRDNKVRIQDMELD